MIVSGMLVCSSFLIINCVYVFCVESFAHIECYSDCSLRGSHLVAPLFMVAILLLNVIDVFSVGALLDRLYMAFQRMCVLCL